MHRPRHTLAAPLATLSAAAVALSMTAAATPASALTAAPSATGPIHYDDGAVALPISPQAQEQSNWCWAATGGTIAAYAGRSVNQNTFCNLAFGRSTGTQCPNSQATLANASRPSPPSGSAPAATSTGA